MIVVGTTRAWSSIEQVQDQRIRVANPQSKEVQMPTMTNSRRKRIQARQRKAANDTKRLAKVAKKKRNA